MNFSERLDAQLKASRTFLTVGLDPRPGELPSPLRDQPEPQALRAFLFGMVEATRDHCAAYKMQLGSYLAFGLEGLSILAELRDSIGPGHLTILDLKAADIPSTMELYRKGVFGRLGFDAMTVNPFLGWDSIREAMKEEGRGLFVLLHTSNPGAADVQEAMTEKGVELWRTFLPTIKELSRGGNVGAVVGATFPEALTITRQTLGGCVPLLVPGVGAQGGSLAKVISSGRGESGGALLINSSRGILNASRGDDWKKAAAREAERLTLEMRAFLKAETGRISPADRQPR